MTFCLECYPFKKQKNLDAIFAPCTVVLRNVKFSFSKPILLNWLSSVLLPHYVFSSGIYLADSPCKNFLRYELCGQTKAKISWCETCFLSLHKIWSSLMINRGQRNAVVFSLLATVTSLLNSLKLNTFKKSNFKVFSVVDT